MGLEKLGAGGGPHLGLFWAEDAVGGRCARLNLVVGLMCCCICTYDTLTPKSLKCRKVGALLVVPAQRIGELRL